ncbi:MAG: hypothetical protein EBY81_07990 [Verrucomicrobia bacterium]|nr:hypothetical protein [Verrucomicrobiota bacterium]
MAVRRFLVESDMRVSGLGGGYYAPKPAYSELESYFVPHGRGGKEGERGFKERFCRDTALWKKYGGAINGTG